MRIEAAVVEMFGVEAGLLSRVDGEKYVFIYANDYIRTVGFPLSASLPVSKPITVSDELMPYFDGLVAEGWLKEIQSQFQKIDETDRFTLLINNGENLAGAVTIRPLPQERYDEVAIHGSL